MSAIGVVQAGYHAKTWMVINLKDPRLKLVVDEDIESKYLKRSAFNTILILKRPMIVVENHIHQHRRSTGTGIFDTCSELFHLFWAS